MSTCPPAPSADMDMGSVHVIRSICHCHVGQREAVLMEGGDEVHGELAITRV